MIDYDKLKNLLNPIINSQIKIEELIMQILPQYYKSNKDPAEPRPKYAIGQKVWCGHKNPIEIEITKADIDGKYLVKDHLRQWITSFCESELYPTKQQLIEARIEYWQNQLNNYEPGYCAHSGIKLERRKIQKAPFLGKIPPEKIQAAVESVSRPRKDCQHESDGKYHSSLDWGALPNLKCKKCGEFYK